MSWQQTIIIGNIGRDPEFKYTPQGVGVCSFSVAVNRVSGRGENRTEKTTWFRVTLWRERAETANNLLRKGMRVMVVGEIDAQAYINKQNQPVATLELTGREFQILESKGESQGASGEYEVSRRNADAAGGSYDNPDDLPF